jgi:predicted N-acetyltransferase YhbS
MKYETRPATEQELEQVLAITEAEDWGFDLEDLEFVRDLDPQGFFVSVDEPGRVVGAASSVTYGSVGWIGNVVVSREHRRAGLGTALSNACVSYLHGHGRAAALFSYAHSEPMYERLGFRKVRKYGVYRGIAGGRPARATDFIERNRLGRSARIGPGSEHVGDICELDELMWGDDRSRLLHAWARRHANLTLVALEPTLRGEERVVGYAIGRANSRGAEVGPLVSTSAAAADALLTELMSRLDGKAVEFTSPLWKPEVARVAERHLDLALEISEWYYPPSSPPVRAEGVYCAASQDKG